MTEYARVTTLDYEGHRVTTILAIVSENDEWLLGRPVNRDGEDRSFYNPEGKLVDVQHLIDKGTITKRVPLVMNLKYGVLEEIRTAG